MDLQNAEGPRLGVERPLRRWFLGFARHGLHDGELLGISERQLRRLRDRYEEDGEEGLRDRRMPTEIIAAVIASLDMA
jgi:hypothetical protein